jgi:hypothetical protein
VSKREPSANAFGMQPGRGLSAKRAGMEMGVGYQVPVKEGRGEPERGRVGESEEQMTAGAGCYRYPPATAGGTDNTPAAGGGSDKARTLN